MSKMIPVTILTGFLGSGKTMLLKRTLNEQRGTKIAVIENELGGENINNDILVQDGDEQIVQMSNSCICHAICSDLVKGLSDLLTHRDNDQIQLDRVVIGATGVANPGPVAQTFFIDDEIASRHLLDAAIMLVDARHGNMQPSKQKEMQRQVGFVDATLITKSDLASVTDVNAPRHRLLYMSPRAPIHTANFGGTLIDTIFDLRSFNLNAKSEIDLDFLREDDHDHSHDHDHDHACSVGCDRDHDHKHGHGHTLDHHRHHGYAYHTDRIASLVFRSEWSLNYTKLEGFLSGVLNIYGEKLLHYKGVLYMEGVDRKVMFQGVHQLMGSDVSGKWDGETPSNRMVFIGIDLPHETILKGLENCLA